MIDLAIEAQGLRLSYGPVTVLDGVDLLVPRGVVYGLLGPNGAGKTTLVNLLSTLMRPDSGTARVLGYDVVAQPAAVRRCISLTGQYATVDELLTARENLVLMGRLRGLDRSGARHRAAELLGQFSLTEAKDRRVGTFSGGMRRRLDIAAGLVSRPDVVFLDEPTTGLDPRSRQEMWDVVRHLVAAGVTVLLTTQYLEEAEQLAQRVAVIDRGRIVAEGTVDELKHRVSAQRLDLTFRDVDDYDAAQTVLGDTVHRDPESFVLGLATTASGTELRSVLDRLDRRGVEVAKVAVRTTTLDDVFFALTGRPPSGHGADDPADQRPDTDSLDLTSGALR